MNIAELQRDCGQTAVLLAPLRDSFRMMIANGSLMRVECVFGCVYGRLIADVAESMSDERERVSV